MTTPDTYPDARIHLPEKLLYEQLDRIDGRRAGVLRELNEVDQERDRLLAVMAFRLRHDVERIESDE